MQKSKFLGFRRLDLHGLSCLQEEMASHNVNGGVSLGYICLEFSYNMEKMLKVATPVPFSDFANIIQGSPKIYCYVIMLG